MTEGTRRSRLRQLDKKGEKALKRRNCTIAYRLRYTFRIAAGAMPLATRTFGAFAENNKITCCFFNALVRIPSAMLRACLSGGEGGIALLQCSKQT